jgi:hypothetical protein
MQSHHHIEAPRLYQTRDLHFSLAVSEQIALRSDTRHLEINFGAESCAGCLRNGYSSAFRARLKVVGYSTGFALGRPILCHFGGSLASGTPSVAAAFEQGVGQLLLLHPAKLECAG